MDPFSAGMFASIGSAFKFADVAVRIAEVGSENAVFVRAIRIVRSDLEEVERLLSINSVQTRLAVIPGKLPWVKTAINNTRCALNDIGKWVERARVEQETTGSIRFETRVRWVFNDHEKLVNRQAELSTCHQQLSNVLNYLVRLEDVPTVPREYGSAACFDDILSRHRKTSGPNASKSKFEIANEGYDEDFSDAATTGPVLTPLSRPLSNSGAWNPPTVDRRISEPPPSLPPIISPPGSPPPTYAVAVSIGPTLHSARSELHPYLATPHNTAVSRPWDLKTPFSAGSDSHWAYRAGFNDVTVPELAGDTVSFSGTNSAGPVNPYEFCAPPTAAIPAAHRGSQALSENLAEMLGDLHFRAELPGVDDSPPPGHPRVRAESEHTLSRSRHTQLRKRTASDISPMLHRRPVPTNALSDSLLTVHELPSSLAISTANTRQHRTESAQQLSELGSFTTEQRSHTPKPTDWNPSTTPASPPPPPHPLFNHHAASFSADSTSSWGLDTQPQTPRTPSSRQAAATSRMQRQKQMLDLLGSIGG